MQIVTTREFRMNQTKVLNAAKNGQSVILTSRVGSFRIVPVSETDGVTTQDITSRIIQSLHEVKLMEQGKLERKSARDLLDEL